MILCGYDTFDIMQKNFKRLAFGKKVTEGYDINYIEVKQQVEQAEKEYDDRDSCNNSCCCLSCSFNN